MGQNTGTLKMLKKVSTKATRNAFVRAYLHIENKWKQIHVKSVCICKLLPNLTNMKLFTDSQIRVSDEQFINF
jgi:hypothetical protein